MSDTTSTAVEDLDGSDEIAFRRRGALAEVELTRPKALNALTLDMIRRFDSVLKDWAADGTLHAVVVRGQGDKSFCAGGDVLAVANSGQGDGELTRVFFYEEYTLNRRIHAFPKPYVALIDGITMGGGMGISMHGSHRIAGDRTMVAMPETAIGFFPDVGATYVLPRLEGRIGFYLALTGARLKAADALYCGIATHYVPSTQILEIGDALAASLWELPPQTVVDKVLEGFAGDPGPAPLAEHREAIDRCFGQDSIEDILRELERDGSDWAKETSATLDKRSPTSLKVSFEALRRGARMSFDDCMTMEYRISQHLMAGPDFYEGIRAVLIDKDHAPQWDPLRLADVDDEMVARYFEPVEGRELRFGEA